MASSSNKGSEGVEFTASDGSTFRDRNAYRLHVMQTEFTFQKETGRRGPRALVKQPGTVNGEPFDLKDLDDCEAAVLGWMSQVQIDQCKDSKILIGPTEGSVFVRDCTDCEFTIACRQLRTRNCQNCTFHLMTTTDPIIEMSSGLIFTPYNGSWHGQRSHFDAAKLDVNDNHWRDILDFNMGGKDGYDVPEPHYELREEVMTDWRFENAGACASLPNENPVPWDARATSVSEAGHAHDESSYGICENERGPKEEEKNDDDKSNEDNAQAIVSSAETLNKQGAVMLTAPGGQSFATKSSYDDYITSIEKKGGGDAMSEHRAKTNETVILTAPGGHIFAEKTSYNDFVSTLEEPVSTSEEWLWTAKMYLANGRDEEAFRLAKEKDMCAGKERLLLAWSEELGELDCLPFLKKHLSPREVVNMCEVHRFFDSAEKHCRDIRSKSLLREVLFKRANIFKKSGDFEKAEKYYIKAGKHFHAVKMYKELDRVDDAFRLAEAFDHRHVADLQEIYAKSREDMTHAGLTRTGLRSRYVTKTSPISIHTKLKSTIFDFAEEDDKSNEIKLDTDERRWKYEEKLSKKRLVQSKRKAQLLALRNVAEKTYKDAFSAVSEENVEWLNQRKRFPKEIDSLRSKHSLSLSGPRSIAKFEPTKKSVVRSPPQKPDRPNRLRKRPTPPDLYRLSRAKLNKRADQPYPVPIVHRNLPVSLPETGIKKRPAQSTESKTIGAKSINIDDLLSCAFPIFPSNPAAGAQANNSFRAESQSSAGEIGKVDGKTADFVLMRAEEAGGCACLVDPNFKQFTLL